MAGQRDRQALRSGTGAWGVALAALVLLPACGQLPGLRDAGRPTDEPPSSTASASADIEAPETFQISETGLWDGRPSLGGVWVAHPGVAEPERVRIVNPGTGRDVIGALFRRERDLPGPALQVSSDAAEALGMLAGAPAELRVTALRRQDPPSPTPDSAEAATTPDPDAAAGPLPDQPAAGRVAEASAAILAGATLPPDEDIEAAPPDAASALNYPFVQVSAGTDRAAADAEVRSLMERGLPARLAEGASGGWRILLGPATTESEQSALRARAVAAGYPDAYLVQR